MAGPVTDREERVLGIIETARAKRPRFKDERITMAHGAGGKATQTLIEGLFVPAFGSSSARRARRRGHGLDRRRRRGADDRQLRGQADPLPGGSIGELAVNGTVNDLAVAGARPLALSLSMVLEEGLSADVLRAEVEAIARAAAGRRRRGRRRRHEGRRARPRRPDVPLHRRRRRGRRARARCRPRACAPATASSSRAPIGDHGTAIMLARGEFELDAAVESDTCSLWPAVDALLDAAGPQPALHARRDARRGRLGAQRAGARLGRGDDRARGRRPGAAGGGRRRGDPRHRPDVRGQRGQARRLRRARGGGRRAGRRCARCRDASARWRSAR